MSDKQAQIVSYSKNYIDGAWRDIGGDRFVELADSFTQQPMARVALGTPADVNAAVAAARKAFTSWSETPAAERGRIIARVGEILGERADELAEAITHEVGMPLKLSKMVQVGGPVREWLHYAELAGSFAFERELGHSLVRRVPVGVAACVTPWNYPLNQITAKVAAALAAGCTVVLKPSELAPASAQFVAEALEQAGCPAGVFNMVLGEGAEVGEALISHPDIDMVSFTGSTAIGQHVAQTAGKRIKRIALELGGKSASVVLDGADIGVAVKNALGACFLNSGQTCNALTRLVVPRSAIPQVREMVAEAAARFAMGDPADGATRLGPLITARQRDRVRKMLADAIANGAEVLAGGPDAPVPATGWFVAPTVLLAEHDQPIAQQEVFGPVLCVIAHDGEDDAVRIANGTDYGLHAAVWAADPKESARVARRLRAGQVDVQGAPYNALAPFGGFGMSGLGREHGTEGLEGFLEYQSLQLPA